MENNIQNLTSENVMNVVIVGHVDHGKSSLIGRLLFDTNSIPVDKVEKIKRICNEQGKIFEYAFLLDAFEEEQKQGITIDVSRIRFSSQKRNYFIIDTPGHKEFLKNMFSGASGAEAALLVIDANEGIQEQSKQHLYLLDLLGIKQIVIAITKMDKISYSQTIFENIKSDFCKYLEQFTIKNIDFIPVNSMLGENFCNKSNNIDWFSGKTIVEALDSFLIKKSSEDLPLRIVVQDVYKFDERRIIVGRIESGEIKVGDEILLSPINKVSKVKSIENWPNNNVSKAKAGEHVAITMETQLFVERGQIISSIKDAPYIADEFIGNIFWMNDQSLICGNHYLFRLGTQEVECRIEKINKIISSSNVMKNENYEVCKYDASEIVIKTKHPIVFDDFNKIAQNGRFVIVDKNFVCGGGVAKLDKYPNLRNSIKDIKSKNISWQESHVTDTQREMRFGHKGTIIWLTGLSGSGKSTLAKALERKIFQEGFNAYTLDGDNIRQGLSSNLGFSPEDRIENIRRTGEVANLFANAGFIVIAAFISPYRSDREKIRKQTKKKFIEVFLDCSLDVCEKRDLKGLYKKARSGEIKEFTGISAPYEIPKNPEILLKTDKISIDESVDEIFKYLIDDNILNNIEASIMY